MYVDGELPDRRGVRRRVSGPPTMMFTATAPVPSLDRVQTLEPKLPGDVVYLLGETRDELGGSALYSLFGHTGLNVPQTDLEASWRLGLAVARALERGLLASVCVVARGGVACALARMALAGELGLEVDLDLAPARGGLDALRRLFSESTGRYLVTLDPARAEEFEALLADIPFAAVGRVARHRRLVIAAAGRTVVDQAVGALRRAWRRRFGRLV